MPKISSRTPIRTSKPKPTRKVTKRKTRVVARGGGKGGTVRTGGGKGGGTIRRPTKPVRTGGGKSGGSVSRSGGGKSGGGSVVRSTVVRSGGGKSSFSGGGK